MLARVLRPYVASVVPYDVTMSGPGIHRGLPGTTSTFVLPLDEPLDVSWAGDPGSRRAGWSSLAGLHTAPAHIHHGLRQRGVQIELTPQGVRALLGVPVSALIGELVGLDDLGRDLPPGLEGLPELLSAATDDAERLTLVNSRLVAALAATGAPAPRAEVGHALARLSRGVSVAVVAEETGYTRRHLGNLFRAECGIAPKEFQRIARFEAAHRTWSRALAARAGSLADVAATCGYADQAHLTREWAAFAGCTPTTWAREEFPYVQDPQRLRGDAGDIRSRGEQR